jgi:6-pyruvoyltetrahydropterin/6-carboxytetrahydropterin synthase
LKELKEIIKATVEDKLDHRNLNEEIPEFKELIPTVENISFVIWHILREHLGEEYELKVRLYETARNFVEYPAD